MKHRLFLFDLDDTLLDFKASEQLSFDRTMRALGLAALPDGLFARYQAMSDGFDVEAGFPADAPVGAAGRVVPVELPGGSIATALHRGSYDTVGETYEALGAWLGDHDYEPAGVAWESYLDEPGVPEPRTLVSIPCRRR